MVGEAGIAKTRLVELVARWRSVEVDHYRPFGAVADALGRAEGHPITSPTAGLPTS